MTRRSRTTISVTIRIPLPPGGNTAMALEFLRNAIKSATTAAKTDTLGPISPMASLQAEEVILTLGRRETVYL
jgi:hypothetical protein